MGAYKNGDSSMYDSQLPSHSTKRVCGIEEGATSGSWTGFNVDQFVKSNSTRATAEWTDFTRRRRPPRLQPFDDSVLAAIHQYKMSKFRVPKQLSDGD